MVTLISEPVTMVYGAIADVLGKDSVEVTRLRCFDTSGFGWLDRCELLQLRAAAIGELWATFTTALEGNA